MIESGCHRVVCSYEGRQVGNADTVTMSLPSDAARLSNLLSI